MLLRRFSRFLKPSPTTLLYSQNQVVLKLQQTQLIYQQYNKLFSTSKAGQTADKFTEADFTYSINQQQEEQKKEENEKKDPYKLVITDKTVQKVNQLHNKDSSKNYLKIFVDSGGCSGFQYNFKMVPALEENEIVFEKDGAKIIVDEITLDFINGSMIDYKKEMIRQSFEVVANPNAEMGCSCGTSFSPKEK
eukprot:403352770